MAGFISQEQRIAVEDVLLERVRQNHKWGHPRFLDKQLWYTILGEEVGEVARAILEKDDANLYDELAQVAAVCIAWMEYFQITE